MGGLLVYAGLSHGWAVGFHPEWIPSFDVSDYLTQALSYRDALQAHQWAALGTQLATPRIHPPGHPLTLALWLLQPGPVITLACRLSALWTALSMALLVLLGHQIDPHRGRWVGLGAAALTASSLLHLRLVSAPMSEPLAMFTALLALLLAVRAARTRVWPAHLLLGLAVLAASLVRYNLFPMLVVPLLADHVGRRWSQPRRLLDWRVLLWLLPTGMAWAIWTNVAPELDQSLVRFFTFSAVEPEFPTWSSDNLLWVPHEWVSEVVGVSGVAWVAGVAFLLGLIFSLRESLPRHSEQPRAGTQLLAFYVVVGVSALTAHHLKQPRNLYTLVPIFYLVALSPALWLPLPRAPRWRQLSAATLLVLATLGVRALHSVNQDPDKLGRLQFVEDRYRTHALAAMVEAGARRPTLFIAGAHRELNEHLITLWLRQAQVDTQLVWETPYRPACGRPDPPANLECTPDKAPRYLQDPALRAQTTFATIARVGIKKLPGRGDRRNWTLRYQHDFDQLAQAAGVPQIDEIDTRDPQLRVLLYASEPPTR